ncbi:MAG TPA: MBL fold metallo-hydrolase [Pyrinomonadaceae bacterium]|nr:MBL fold metallo-hydrolase [Pyrinomonadaceae bacterium]
MKTKYILIALGLFLCSAPAFGQGNGKLQIHYMDVGQGDGAILISPLGETVLFDNGVWEGCDKPLAYLESLGVTQIDYMLISHYHSDHFGCTREVLNRFPLKNFSYDRPGAYSGPVFRSYVRAVGQKRKHVHSTTSITLDAGSANPVKINIAGYNGAGVVTDNENDRSVVAVIHFGHFDAVMGGDLSGFQTEYYKDIETVVARRLGQVELYKVNHHGSSHSSNRNWLNKIRPKVAVISMSDDNDYGHPTPSTMGRLHASTISKTYWTSGGAGAAPKEGRDMVANGSVVVEVAPGANEFSVKYGTQTDIHQTWPGAYTGRR